MPSILDWLKTFWKGRNQSKPVTSQQEAILVEGTYLESQDRVTRALPQTHELSPLLTLVQPPAPSPPTGRSDHGPDPIAECSMTCTAAQPFRTADLTSMFIRDKREEVLSPTIYIVSADGFTTYLNGKDTPAEGIAIRASWPMYEGSETPEHLVSAAADKIAEWLAARPEGFHYSEKLDPDTVEQQFSRARQIIAVKPEFVAIIAEGQGQDDWFDGVKTWNILHAMDVRWGDMDCFHWLDATHEPLFTVEVDDQRLGYALPEEIAAGRQHFRALRFIFTPARCSAPIHVLAQMMRAAECFQEQTGARLMCNIDGEDVDGPQALESAIARMVENLEALGTEPGSNTVCLLR